MSKHIIHVQKIRVEVSSLEAASFLQERMQQIWKEELAASIESILDELAPPGRLIRIESLHLNLGVIGAGNFDEDFKSRFVSRLKDALLSMNAVHNISIAPASGEGAGDSPAIDPLLFFLVNGRLPWYQESLSRADWESSLLGSTGDNWWTYFRQWYLKQTNGQPKIIQRLTWQFSDAFLSRLLTGISGTQPGIWQDVYDDLYKLLTAAFLVPAADARTTIWRTALQNQLSGTRERHALAAQVQTIVGKCMQHLRLKTGPTGSIPPGIPVLKTGLVQEALIRLYTPGKPANAGPEAAGHGTGSVTGKNSRPAGLPVPVILPGSFATDSGDDSDNTAIPVKNAGLVILHPFLSLLFRELGLLKGRRFVRRAARQKAVMILHYLATGSTEAAEYDLTLEKILCGMPDDASLPLSIPLSDREKEEAGHLLQSVLNHWPPLKNTSREGLQLSFLRRGGELSLKEAGWFLQIRKETIDILLDQLPWGFSMIKLAWMPSMLSVDWRSPY